ncbi:P-loop containing nucleoside triphosphate hydrolase protein, partial [Pisolithus marmoratus]
MGPTGAGKSSFVAKATGNGNEGVGHSLTSHTSEIKATRCMIEGSNVVLVDTPGFDDTKKSDLQILESISDWLSKTYTQGTLLSGILYFHRISDNRMAGTPLKNLRVFQKLCGSKAMSQVVLVTTMWDEVEVEVGNERLEELKGNYWKFMIVQGSSTYCYRNTVESSRQLLLQLVEGKRREVRLQKEIADKHLELRETDAGRELYSRLDQVAEKRAEILARIAAQKHLTGDQATADDLRKQYDSLK